MFCIRMNTCFVSSNERAAAKINRWVIIDNWNWRKIKGTYETYGDRKFGSFCYRHDN